MNKAYFLRNPSDISELKATVKNREAHEYVIEKVVELGEKEYEDFAYHFLLDYSFIVNNSSLMYSDSNKILHCILVTVSGATDGILIKRKGDVLYAAYWSYLKT